MYTSFRLLAELYSFLLKDIQKCIRALSVFVSVSLQSYIHSYWRQLYMRTNQEIYVSVSLRSIIHSYTRVHLRRWFICHCFRLLMEYHSFLSEFCKFLANVIPVEFLSPYGVSFILIYEGTKLFIISH